ncbi:hypothetical protein PGT21_023665 [Puccinia graminis f. sp. tritici]|uniref:Uncharacterized protein n=1 Tax=Puccinia graminis f. sp. tritici TaxID=56615 RepID=A0A5B0NEG6_PUCGR|nr:hypothetical protein PGT21_023665 [Puccinia graminis f. sp. tritici]
MSKLMEELSSSDLLRLMKTVSPALNPFSFLLDAINRLDSALSTPQYWKLVVVNLVIHMLLALQAAIALTWKFSRNKRVDGQSAARCWFWRQRYVFASQQRPYCEPNGNQILELCQLIGCTCLEVYYVCLYRMTKNLALSYSNFGSAAFWFTLSHLPGIMGFWFASWSALYLVLLCPQRSEVNPTSKKNPVWDPILMNVLCIGVPILLVIIFSVLGIILSIQNHDLSTNLRFLRITLAQLATMWTPEVPQIDPQTIQLFAKPLDILIQTTRRLIRSYQVIAFSWAIMSMLMLIFYSVTMAAIWRILHNTIKVASGKAPLMIKLEKEFENHEAKQTIDSTTAEHGLKTLPKPACSSPPLSDIPTKEINPGLACQLRRNFYFLSVSCTLMATCLVCNIFFGLLLGIKIQEGIDIQAGNMMFALCTTGSLLSSLSLLLQSVVYMISQ